MRIMTLNYVPDDNGVDTHTVVVDREDSTSGRYLFHVKMDGNRIVSHHTSGDAVDEALKLVFP